MHILLIFAVITSSFAGPETSLHPKSNNRIIGGSPVSINVFPFQVSLQYQGFHRCGGAIVTTRYVLTATHCTQQTNPAEMTVRVGSHLHDQGGQIIPVESYHEHPSFNPINMDYDINVVRLAGDIVFGGGVAPIALPPFNTTVEGGLAATVSGWGITAPGSADLSPMLLAVDIVTVSLEDCLAAYYPLIITEQMTCAGVPEGGRDSCSGDSGGPLVVHGELLVGLVSFGSCGRPGYPGGYANIAMLRDYIDEIIGETEILYI